MWRSIPTPSKLLLLPAIVLPLAAAGIHYACALPAAYSWSRTLELLGLAVVDRYFALAALFVLLAAAARRAAPGAAVAGRFRQGLSLALALAVTLMLALLSARYSPWDYLALPLVAALLYRTLLRTDFAEALFGMAATVFVLVVVSYVFTIFKSQLFTFGVVLDDWLIAGERALFGEPLYLTVARWASARPAVVGFSDWAYFLFFHHIALTALFLFAQGDRREQWRYVASLSLCYLLGGVSYYLFPAYGPAFYDPEKFAYLHDSAPFTLSIQQLLADATNAAAAGKLERIETFAFIACMPSLHMAHESLMLFFARRSLPMSVFSAFFWLSSIVAVLVLGWHYLFDVAGGMLLAALVIGIVWRALPPQRA